MSGMERVDLIANQGVPQAPKPRFILLYIKFLGSLVTTEEHSRRIDAHIDNKGAWHRFPIFMVSLIILQISLFFASPCTVESYYYLCYMFSTELLTSDDSIIPINLIQDDILHFAIVLVIQLVFGIPQEIAFGSRIIGLLYVIGIAPLTFFFCAIFGFGYCGDSGGVYTLVVFQMFNLLMNPMPYREFQSFFIFAYLFNDTGKCFLSIFLNLFTNNSYIPLFVFRAHSLLIGLFFSWFFVTLKTTSTKWQIAAYICMSVYFLGCVTCFILFVNNSPFFYDLEYVK